MKKLVLLFIDGIGLAPPSDNNLISELFAGQTDGYGLKSIEEPLFFSSSVLCPVKATLGMKGEPQSATGQTSIFTGINAAGFLGYHLPAFPNRELVEVIEDKSIMKYLREKGVSVTSANMYSHQFFIDREKSEKNRFPVSTLTIRAAGVPFRMADEYRAGQAVFADITGELLRKRGYDIDEIDPEDAGRRIRSILDENQFVFFEYFMTDHYGHKRKREELKRSVAILDRFVTSICGTLAEDDEGLLIISDHGNAEDMTTGGHTSNPVPGLLIGSTEEMRQRFSLCTCLTDIYFFLQDYYKN